MKKVAFLAMCVLFLVPVVGFAAQPTFSMSRGEQTVAANAAVQHDTGISALAGIIVITDGVNDCKVIIYDGTSTSGTVKYETTVKGADHYGGRIWTFPLMIQTGIYVVVSGTGGSYILEYIER
jgi:hypothetical protein